jgi:hypothetical protein
MAIRYQSSRVISSIVVQTSVVMVRSVCVQVKVFSDENAVPVTSRSTQHTIHAHGHGHGHGVHKTVIGSSHTGSHSSHNVGGVSKLSSSSSSRAALADITANANRHHITASSSGSSSSIGEVQKKSSIGVSTVGDLT